VRVRTPTDVGRSIRERRKALHINQAELARRVGVSRQWVVGIEKGKGRADFSLVMRTLDALGIALWAEDEDSAAAQPGDSLPFSAVRIADVFAAHPGADAGK